MDEFASSLADLQDAIYRNAGVPGRLLGRPSISDKFIEDIVKNPEDDTPRLIYADWCQDHGLEARGEFIYRQISTGEVRVFPADSQDAGLGWWPLDDSGQVIFKRGFATCFVVNSQTWEKHGKSLVQRNPVEGVILSDIRVTRALDRDEWFTDVFSLPWWFARFYATLSDRPVRKTREEALRYLSDYYIKWAKQ